MIYHYTSIETLSKILKSKKIRFKRLDLVDDPDEYIELEGISIAPFVFVSCWTRQKEENMPQWIIYGDHRHGVRIGMNENIFNIHEETTPMCTDKGYELVKAYSLIKHTESIQPLYFKDKKILKDICYVDDVQRYKSECIQFDGTHILVNPDKFDIYKSRDWQFQKECRFTFFAHPRLKDILPEFSRDLFENNHLEQASIDVELLDKVYNTMEIKLGPDVTEAEILAVQGLMNKYLNRSDYTKSKFPPRQE